MSAGFSPASASALLTDSHAIERVVRLEGRICGVSPTPTMQYLSVNAPIVALPRSEPYSPASYHSRSAPTSRALVVLKDCLFPPNTECRTETPGADSFCKR